MRTIVIGAAVAAALCPAAQAARWTAPVELDARYVASYEAPFEGPHVALDRDGRAVVLELPRVKAPIAVREIGRDGVLGPRTLVPASEGAQEAAVTLAHGVVTVAWLENDGSRGADRADEGCCQRVHAATWRLGDPAPAPAPVSPPRGNVEMGFLSAGGALAWTYVPDHVLAPRSARMRVQVRLGRATGGGVTRNFPAGRGSVRIVDLDATPSGGVAVTFLRWLGRVSRLEQAILGRRGHGRRHLLARQPTETGFDETRVAFGPGGRVAALYRGRRGVVLARGRSGGRLRRAFPLAQRASIYDSALAVASDGTAFAGLSRYPSPPLHLLASRRTARRIRVRGREPSVGAPLAGSIGATSTALLFDASAGGLPPRVEAAVLDARGRVRAERVLGDARVERRECRPLELTTSLRGDAIALWGCGEEHAFPGEPEPTLHLARRTG